MNVRFDDWRAATRHCIGVATIVCCVVTSLGISHADDGHQPMKTKVGPPVDPETAAQIDPDQVDLPSAVKRIIEQTNQFRSEQGLKLVAVDAKLQKCAQSFADYMMTNDRYGHRADGRTPAQRAKAAGYEYCEVRENIARVVDSLDNTGQGLGKTLTQGWIDSPPHRENMLADDVTQTGVAIATDKGLTFYAVQLFGRPASLRIAFSIYNRTDSDLTLEIGDAGGASDRDEMDLPPGYGYRFERCRSVTASLVDHPTKITIDSNGGYEIRRVSDALEFTEMDKTKTDDVDQL